MDYQTLKTRQRTERGKHPTNVALRVHRALYWLNRAGQCEDEDGRLIFLGIAFNAAYAHDLDYEDRPGEDFLPGRFSRSGPAAAGAGPCLALPRVPPHCRKGHGRRPS